MPDNWLHFEMETYPGSDDDLVSLAEVVIDIMFLFVCGVVTGGCPTGIGFTIRQGEQKGPTSLSRGISN